LALPLAKAGEIETARIARPTMVIFFMLSSLEKDTGQSITNLGLGSRTAAASPRVQCRAIRCAFPTTAPCRFPLHWSQRGSR
jgi:hypothetical protein